MKVNDLMIGDYVTFKDSIEKDNLPIKVKIVALGYQHSDDEDEALVRIDDSDTCDIIGIDDEVVGYPLTSEILEKNGFVKDKSVGYCERYIWADSMRLPHTVVEFSFGDDGATMLNCWTKLNDGENNIHICDPNYVHELQHALRLCDITREIII